MNDAAPSGARLDVTRLKTDAASFGWPLAIGIRVVRRLLGVLRVELVSVRATPVDPHREAPALPPDIRIRELSEQDLFEHVDDPELPYSRGFVADALARGDRAFGALEGERLVAYLWRTSSIAPHVDNILVKVEKPYSYLYKSYTRPSHRGKRLMPALILWSDGRFLEAGYTHRCAFIDVCNIASIRGARRIGSRFLGYAGFVRWFGRIVPFRTRAVRDIGFDFVVEH